jgi:hypothetical protein
MFTTGKSSISKAIARGYAVIESMGKKTKARKCTHSVIILDFARLLT